MALIKRKKWKIQRTCQVFFYEHTKCEGAYKLLCQCHWRRYYTIPLNNNSSLFTGGEAIQQFAVADGGNANQSKTYFLKGGKSEKNDGFGDVHAIMGKICYDIPKARLKTSLAGGYYHLPDVKDYALNKYGFPSYTQLNADIRYSFTKAFKGLEAQLLVVGKLKNGEAYNSAKFLINKENMVQCNFVLNYYF